MDAMGYISRALQMYAQEHIQYKKATETFIRTVLNRQYMRTWAWFTRPTTQGDTMSLDIKFTGALYDRLWREKRDAGKSQKAHEIPAIFASCYVADNSDILWTWFLDSHTRNTHVMCVWYVVRYIIIIVGLYSISCSMQVCMELLQEGSRMDGSLRLSGTKSTLEPITPNIIWEM